MASAQVLLTHADLADRERYLNARSTLLTLLALKVIPVINENDTVVNDEIRFGDNDTLGALVANLVDADALRDPHRPARPVLGRPAQGPAGALHRRSRRRRPGAGGDGRRRRHRHRPRRHADQDPGRQACRGQRHQHRHRLGPRTRRAAAPGRRRSHRHGARGRHGQAGGAQAMDGRPPAAARRGGGGRRRGGQAARRGQEPAADRRARGDRRVRARRRHRGAHAGRRRGGARPGQLLGRRGAAHRAQAFIADRSACWAMPTSRN